MLRLIKYFLLGLVLLLVCFASALLAMRFAIHGREVRVPKFLGMAPTEAERVANSEGLVLSIENRFYSADVPEGYIVSQLPAPNTKVRRGWKVRVAESLGPQRASIPNVVGESERVAELNISRRGLEIGTVATIHFPGAQPATVIAQSPPADARNAVSPKIGLVLSAADNTQSYIMPNFVGQSLTEANDAIKQAGFTLGKVDFVQNADGPSEIVLRQFPAAGQKIAAGGTISLVVRK
ncbi:MAG TPA: PASTA domain-containing protein [Candidatus Angelobacter sp.]